MFAMVKQSRIGGIIVILQLLVLTACAARSEAPGRFGASQLTRADMAGYSTVLDAVEAMRSGWLQSRTPVLLAPARTVVSEHMAGASPVWVYRDGTRLGGPDELRKIPIAEVSTVEYMDGRAATNRYGMNHDNGAILVTSRSSAEG